MEGHLDFEAAEGHDLIYDFISSLCLLCYKKGEKKKKNLKGATVVQQNKSFGFSLKAENSGEVPLINIWKYELKDLQKNWTELWEKVKVEDNSLQVAQIYVYSPVVFWALDGHFICLLEGFLKYPVGTANSNGLNQNLSPSHIMKYVIRKYENKKETVLT